MTETAVQTPVAEAEPESDGLSTPPEGVVTGEQENGAQSPEPKEARFRRERNEAREQLAQADARIERMQRAEIDRLAGERLQIPNDLFSLSGNEVADYLTDSGDVDADKVAADVAAILAERPGLQRRPPVFDPSQGTGGRPPQEEPKWSGFTAKPY